MSNGLKVHVVYISQRKEDSEIDQERCWANVTTQTDQAYVHQRIDVDVLQTFFISIDYGRHAIDDMNRQKRARMMREKKKRVKQEEGERKGLKNFEKDRQQVRWKHEGIEEWYQELKIREIVVCARETLVRRQEQEYHQMERCPLCEKGNKRQVEGYNVHADLYVENSHERKMMRPHGERHKLLGNYIRNTGAGGASERSASPNILELLLC